MKAGSKKLTPMMEQYLRIKEEHHDRILLYRMGDFYETFFEDAVTASQILGITLTTRGRSNGEPIPLAGVPYHSVDSYIPRLLAAGHSIAICEQTEDPAQAKGVVRREVVEVITPGTVAIEEVLPRERAVFCLSLVPDDTLTAYALGDVSTGELLAGQEQQSALLGLPARFKIGEVIFPEDAADHSLLRELRALYPDLSYCARKAWDFSAPEGEALLQQQFSVRSSATLGLRDDEGRIPGALGGLLLYFKALKKSDLSYIDRLEILREDQNMVLDRVTVENLELLEPLRGEDKSATLFGQIKHTRTAMGARLLARWLLAPLMDKEAIIARQDAVATLLADGESRRELSGLLSGTNDLERLSGRLSGQRARPRDLRALADTLDLLPDLQAAFAQSPAELLQQLAGEINLLTGLLAELDHALVDDPPAQIADGGMIADGYDEELDKLRGLSRDGRDWILSLQDKERARTGITNLRIGYNRVFGYYIEVSKGQMSRVPDDYTAKQTLTGSQRYITPELKSREEEILGAEDRRVRREIALFEKLRAMAYAEHQAIQKNGKLMATLDVLASLAELAERRDYCRPEITEEDVLDISEGRHPVVEELLSEPFIANDVSLDSRGEQILLLTGPNMGGKSTYLRTSALIVIMAQIGSYVPARRARVGLTDKVFTRVGASDNLSRGQSTFLIEMEETAYILRNLTEKSLVVLDEIGRGTSTYDGLSLAWAVLEHLHAAGRPHPKTLFATHYHELTRLALEHERLFNYHVTVKEWQDDIIFLRRVEPGPAGRSYGIHVAKLAGIPQTVTSRAFEILNWIESGHGGLIPADPGPRAKQQDLFPDAGHPMLDEIRETDISTLTPLDALNLLEVWQQRLAKEGERS